MKKTVENNILSSDGFTLIEVICAIAILTIGILSLYSLQVSAIHTNGTANIISTSSAWASDRVEIIVSRPYSCSPVQTNCQDLDDSNGDGILGLNNTTPADHSVTSPDGRYTVLWNVAVNTPVPGTKTIRVIVTSQDHGVAKSVVMTYVKGETI